MWSVTPERARRAPEMADLPEIGTAAPEFDLPLADGRRLTSTELRGTAALLFFFPKASTPG